jgi:hypothetical protein
MRAATVVAIPRSGLLEYPLVVTLRLQTADPFLKTIIIGTAQHG